MRASATPRQASWRRRSLWPFIAALVIAVFATYANSISTPFVFDDVGAVENNPTIRHLDYRALLPPNDGSTTTGRPLVNLTYALNYAISGAAVWSYHLGNIIVHAVAAVVLFGLVRQTLLLRRGTASATVRPTPASLGVEFSTWGAFFTALLWALHPLQTETVVTIAQRTESLCAVFYLLTLLAFAKGASAHRADGHYRDGWFAIAVVASALGMATKEVMVTAPLVVLLYDRTFIAGSFAVAWRQRRGWYVALASTWVLLLVLVLRAGGGRGAAAGFGLGINPWTYLLTQSRALLLYAKLAVWPFPLVLDYGTAVARSWSDVWWQSVALTGALVFAVWGLFKNRSLGFVATFFFVVLAPSSSVVPLVTQTIAEHRMYLPLAAVIAAGVLALHAVAPPRALLAAFALAFALLVVTRNDLFRDPLAIWSDTVAKYPLAARPHNNLALALEQRGRWPDAEVQFAEAIRLDPNYVTAHYDYGVALLNRGYVDGAVEQLQATVRLAPDHTDAQVNLGVALVRAGRLSEAIAHLETARRLGGGMDVDHNLAVAHATLGLNLARNHQLDQAADHLSRALVFESANIDARANLGNVRLLQGRVIDAIACYTEVLKRQPNDQHARENLAIAQEALRARR